jgi:DNA-binding TFAR19-related protein (PDSD5 family)
MDNDAELAQQVAQLDSIARSALDKDALSRLSNIKAADTKKWLQTLVVVAQLLQQQKLSVPVTDAALKQLLTQMDPKKRETKITFK